MKKLWELYSYSIILFVLSLLSVCIFLIHLDEHEKKDFMKITVNEGDSLWKIAGEFSDEHKLTSTDFVKWVEKNNGILGGRIFPGDEIVIPVVSNKSSQTEYASSYLK
ncbi:LysM peptidoglycan-binding domain-containing protein [Bacillus sp. FJAT-29790]|uniref:cell division suppressor protein YneA n=1 Tax=Bacillus sp. FJAT-29790 TaxID=1895002 RepID=UPI0020B45EC7|nr:LysM peptidoglycan-binding domain-containing protein [Bacillus sp. FJAT-29790]